MTQARTNDTICWRSIEVPRWRPVDFYCYLLHFEQPIGNPNEPKGKAQHYLGACSNLDARLLCHRRGNSAAIMHAVHEQGIGFELARLWPCEDWEASRDLEHVLKRRHNSPQLCPICQHKPKDVLVRLREGHWPLRLHSQVGPRRAMPRYQNIPMRGGDSR